MDFKIPLFELNFDRAEEDAILDTIRSRWISTGPKTAELENKFAKMLGVKHAVALTNCTASLHLALILLGIQPGDEVICPSLTFVATVNAIKYVGGVPVFADVTSLENLTLDPEEIENKITAKTKALMLMHYGGYSCNMNRILSIAEKHGLRIIEDACHGPLSSYNGKKLGTFGDFGCFSFFSNKNISTGEGGMLVTNSTELFENAKVRRSHGMTSLSYERGRGHSTKYDVIELGYNYRMDDMRASIGIVQLEKLENDLMQRARIREYYINKLGDMDEIIIPFRDYPFFSSNYIFVVILRNSSAEKRDSVRHLLASRGIQTSIHYPAVHRFAIYSEFSTQLPNTEYVTDNLITLPMFSGLSFENIDFIAKMLKDSLAEK